MPCYKPITGFRSRKANPSGRRPVVFSKEDGFSDLPVDLPCGQCIGCRLERSRQWATRCMHEASLWDMNCSLTLTYSDEFLPINSSLVPEDVTLFLKRLRKHWCVPRGFDDFGNRFSRRLSYFLCGEYGGQFQRPHYHVLLFGVWFADSCAFKKSGSGYQLYRSATLDKLWPFGHADIGSVTFESAAYAARYVVEKITGEDAEVEYRGRVPPFVRMSLRPSIGKLWFGRFFDDVYPTGNVVVRGREFRAPIAYDRLFDKRGAKESAVLEETKEARYKRGLKFLKNQSPRRLAVREAVARARLSLYKK